jgi:hypothetical protein
MKITATVDERNLYSSISLFEGVSLSEASKQKVSREVGSYLANEIDNALSAQGSTVSGENFSSLSKEYASIKRSLGLRAVPNLELTGALRDALSSRETSEGVDVGFFNSREAQKADGHNNFSGLSRLPKRRFLPYTDQSFKRNISQNIEQILASEVSEQLPFSAPQLTRAETKEEFRTLIKSAFPSELSYKAIKSAIIANEKFFDALSAAGLTRWL